MLGSPSLPAAHFSAREFFRDSPWLNVPAHRKADILVEPLYPRLGLLGGASEGGGGGKVSKLAALAAARKKKEEGKASPGPEARNGAEPAEKGLSLRERLATNGKPKQAERIERRPSPVVQRVPEKPKEKPEGLKPKQPEETKPEQPKIDIHAPPSTFAATIVGDATRTEPSRLHSNSVDLLKIYGQDTEPFDFAGPSPDDVVANAQSSAKGLAFRRKI